MTARDLTTVALRILGLMYVVNAFTEILGLLNIGAFQGSQGFGDSGISVATLLVTTLIQAAVVGTLGLALLVNTNTLIRWLFPELGDEPLKTSGRELHRLAFAVVGVIIAASAVPYAVTTILEMIWYLGGERRHLFSDLIGREWINYAQALTGVVVGVVVYELATWLASRIERNEG